MKNDHLLHSLTVREAIKEKVDKGVITEEEGKILQHNVRTRTNKLLKLNTIPKELVDRSLNIENRSVLLELKNYPELDEGESKSA